MESTGTIATASSPPHHDLLDTGINSHREANHPPRAIPEGGDGETGAMALAMATPVGVKAGGLLVGQDFVGGGRQLKWQVILLKRKNAHWTREKQGKVISLHIRNQGFGDNGPFSFAATLVFQLKHISPKLPNYFILVPAVFICHNRRPTIKCL